MIDWIICGHYSQRKFRDYAKSAGYDLINGNKVVAMDGAVPVTPVKKRKSPIKKGKASKGDMNEDATNGDASEKTTGESPTKKAKTSQPSSGAAVNGAENVVKPEAEGEDEYEG